MSINDLFTSPRHIFISAHLEYRWRFSNKSQCSKAFEILFVKCMHIVISAKVQISILRFVKHLMIIFPWYLNQSCNLYLNLGNKNIPDPSYIWKRVRHRLSDLQKATNSQKHFTIILSAVVCWNVAYISSLHTSLLGNSGKDSDKILCQSHNGEY